LFIPDSNKQSLLTKEHQSTKRKSSILTFKEFETTLQPKVCTKFSQQRNSDGLVNYHDQVHLGHDGQHPQHPPSYCAGNSSIDAFAWRRNICGLHASSLILPMVLDVDAVAKHAEIEEALSARPCAELTNLNSSTVSRPICISALALNPHP